MEDLVVTEGRGERIGPPPRVDDRAKLRNPGSGMHDEQHTDGRRSHERYEMRDAAKARRLILSEIGDSTVERECSQKGPPANDSSPTESCAGNLGSDLRW